MRVDLCQSTCFVIYTQLRNIIQKSIHEATYMVNKIWLFLLLTLNDYTADEFNI